MSLLLTELAEKLKQVDEISLMEILGITSEDLVERFMDIIEDHYDELQAEFESETDEDI